MKSNFFKIFIFILIAFFSKSSLAENLNITSKTIFVDKKTETTIFEKEVVIKDNKNNIIQSDFAEYNKKLNLIGLKNNVIATDADGNIFKTNVAKYNEKLKLFESMGETIIITNKGTIVKTENVILNNLQGNVLSKNKTIIEDFQKNKIELENFEYQAKKNIFKSVGNIKVIDNLNNSYEFSQIYIDEKNKEIVGTDAKLYINQKDFKFDDKNKPRVFSNAINISENKSKFIKSSFTMCDYRKGDKCPPWELSASEMTHDKKSKTIFYDNAIIKIYDIPIFYFPKLAHPDPSVDRRSGFLNPSYSDTKNLGSSLSVPYFLAIDEDRDLTINSRLFATEHPLFLGEYRQVFKNSNLVFDFGHTQGYKKISSTKKAGDKSHFFSNFTKRFMTNKQTENNLEINLQHVSDKKYLKLYKIDSNLVDYETETLENFIDFSHYDDDNNLSLAFRTSNYRTLKDSYNDKYEYIFPDITLNKNLFSEKFGNADLQTNFKVHNYDTNKTEKLLVNNFDWELDRSNNFFDSKFLTSLKNVNYDIKNVQNYKTDTTNEFFGSIGYLASVDLFKKVAETSHILRPKFLLKYSPNHMRKENEDLNLNEANIFSLNRLNSNDNFESGTNLTIGIDYEKINKFNKLDFSIAQIINEKDNNKNMPDKSSLDKRFSDLVGSVKYENNKNFKFDYDYLVDQNFKETNYNEILASYDTNNIKFNFNYLEDNRGSLPNEYLKTEIEVQNGNNGLFTLSNKRNLVKNSSEYYDLSYEYINDCLRAGLVYRREFYNDSEIEPENSLMFTITLNSFGSITSPTFSQ